MALVETESLVLKNYDLGDADKIIVFLTRDHGIIRGVAKGVKRLKSRFGSGLEPLSVITLTYFAKDNSELVSIQQADLVSSNFDVAADPDFLRKFAFLIDLLIIFSPPNDPNETLYRMVLASIDAAAKQPSRIEAIGLYFEMWLLRLSGFAPDWSRCELCGKGVEGDAFLGPSMSISCHACSSGRRDRVVPVAEMEMVSAARRLSPADFATTYGDRSVEITNLSSIFRKLVNQAAGREVRGEISLAVRR